MLGYYPRLGPDLSTSTPVALTMPSRRTRRLALMIMGFLYWRIRGSVARTGCGPHDPVRDGALPTGTLAGADVPEGAIGELILQLYKWPKRGH